jgi:hypothetical protein
LMVIETDRIFILLSRRTLLSGQIIFRTVIYDFLSVSTDKTKYLSLTVSNLPVGSIPSGKSKPISLMVNR